MNSAVFSVFSRELVKHGAMPPANNTIDGQTTGEEPKKPSMFRKVVVPAASIGLGAIGLRKAIRSAPQIRQAVATAAKASTRDAKEVVRDMGTLGKDLAEASLSPGKAIKKGWRELAAAPGTEKRVNELKDVLRDALGGKKYSLDVIDVPDSRLRQSGIGSIGSRYHGRITPEQAQKALGDAAYRRSSGEFVLNRDATPEQVEAAYRRLQGLSTRESQGFEVVKDKLRSGLSTVTRNMPGEKVILPVAGGIGLYGDLSQTEDPRTGRKLGLGERVGRASVNQFTNLAFNPAFARQPGIVTGLVGQGVTSAFGGTLGARAGRAIDIGAEKFRADKQPPPIT